MANITGKYWEGINADIDGMLGGVPSVTGFSHVSKVDLQGSRSFLAKLGIGRKNGRRKVANALEGGAGIGRVTKGLLLDVADEVDVIEPVAKFVKPLQDVAGVRHVFNVGLEDWYPAERTFYNLIWIQWCVGYLTDEQLVGYLKRCSSALDPDDGIIVVKDNLSTSGSDAFDDAHGDVTREHSKFLSLFEEAGLRVIRTETQNGFAPGASRQLLPVRSYALKPKSSIAGLLRVHCSATQLMPTAAYRPVRLASALACLLIDPRMEGREKLLEWATEHEVLLRGVRPMEIPDRGAGIVACRRLEKGEDILHVPIQLVRSLDTVPAHISCRLPSDLSIHALLATELAVDGMRGLSLWKDSLTTLAGFNTGLPFMWHEKLQKLLPKPAGELLENQRCSFYRDWTSVTKAFPDLRRDDYLQSWFIVNTRAFSYATPEMEKYPPLDRLALVPIADLFNHADSGSEVSFTTDGYVVSAEREYRVGEEICIMYGTHTNDFLLVEYGFVPAVNRWDKICLDDVILPKLSSIQKDLLQGGELLGPFMLDCETLGCEKTQAAIRLLCRCSRGQWEESSDGEGCGEHCRREMNALLRSLLVEYTVTVKKAVRQIEELQVGQGAQRELLGRRWKQIEMTVTQAINWLQVKDCPRPD